MSQDQIRLQNYNYDAHQFIERVRNLFIRDRHFLGPIIQRSALVRTPSGNCSTAYIVPARGLHNYVYSLFVSLSSGMRRAARASLFAFANRRRHATNVTVQPPAF
jgi:hypothetical protein